MVEEPDLRVIGAGFGRTGTLSLRVALERLGFGPCYHFMELLEHPEHAARWTAAATGGPVDWGELLGGYRAAGGWAGAAPGRPLVERFPDGRVVLSVRDPERWYDSVASTIHAISVRSRSAPPGSLPPAIAGVAEMADTLV